MKQFYRFVISTYLLSIALPIRCTDQENTYLQPKKSINTVQSCVLEAAQAFSLPALIVQLPYLQCADNYFVITREIIPSSHLVPSPQTKESLELKSIFDLFYGDLSAYPADTGMIIIRNASERLTPFNIYRAVAHTHHQTLTQFAQRTRIHKLIGTYSALITTTLLTEYIRYQKDWYTFDDNPQGFSWLLTYIKNSFNIKRTFEKMGAANSIILGIASLYVNAGLTDTYTSLATLIDVYGVAPSTFLSQFLMIDRTVCNIFLEKKYYQDINKELLITFGKVQTNLKQHLFLLGYTVRHTENKQQDLVDKDGTILSSIPLPT